MQKRTPASKPGLEQVNRGCGPCYLCSGVLGTQMGSITEGGAWEVHERRDSDFLKPCKSMAAAGPQSGNLWNLQCGFDLSVIWPKARRVHHRVPSTHAVHQCMQVVGICL